MGSVCHSPTSGYLGRVCEKVLTVWTFFFMYLLVCVNVDLQVVPYEGKCSHNSLSCDLHLCTIIRLDKNG